MKEKVKYEFDPHDRGIYLYNDNLLFILLAYNKGRLILIPLTKRKLDDKLKVDQKEFNEYYFDINNIDSRSNLWIERMRPECISQLDIHQYAFLIEIIKNYFLGIISEGVSNIIEADYHVYDEYCVVISEKEEDSDFRKWLVEKVEASRSREKDEEIYDLLYGSYSTGDPPKFKKHIKKFNKHDNEEKITGTERIWFSRTEIEKIAYMSCNAVMNLYSVNAYIATRYIVNSKNILGINTDRMILNTYAQYFEMGRTVEEVHEMYKKKKSLGSIQNSYYAWDLGRKYGLGGFNSNARLKWENPLKLMSLTELVKFVLNTTIADFAYQTHCTLKCAGEIMSDLKSRFLCINPFYAVFGKDVYDDNFFENIEKDNKVATIDRIIRDVVSEIQHIYIDSFIHHIRILYGSFPIPEEVPSELKSPFIQLIKCRYRMNRPSKMNKEDIEFIKNHSDEEVAATYLLRYNTIKSIRDKEE